MVYFSCGAVCFSNVMHRSPNKEGANVFSDPWLVTLQASLATHLFISGEEEEGKDPAPAPAA